MVMSTKGRKLHLRNISKLLTVELRDLSMRNCTMALKLRMCTMTKHQGHMIFNPAHPHANDDGMVEMPNVDVSREMIDLISASRAYEANLTVVKTSVAWLSGLINR